MVQRNKAKARNSEYSEGDDGAAEARPGIKSMEKKGTRRRRTADEARTLILDAAEMRLREVGPEGLKLQEIAQDIGVSHPAILHHFGSRQGLVQAVVSRALESLRTDLFALLGEPAEGPVDVHIPKLLTAAYEVLAQRGHARLLAWLVLGDQSIEDDGNFVRTLAQAGHAHLNEGDEGPQFNEILYIAMLIAFASLGAGVAGEVIHTSAGLPHDRQTIDGFNTWFSQIIQTHVQSITGLSFTDSDPAKA